MGAFLQEYPQKTGYPLQSLWRAMRRAIKYFRFYPLRGLGINNFVVYHQMSLSQNSCAAILLRLWACNLAQKPRHTPSMATFLGVVPRSKYLQSCLPLILGQAQMNILHLRFFIMHFLFFDMKIEQALFAFFLFSVFGWLFELFLELISGRGFVNRGFFYGPIVPIYGVGFFFAYTIYIFFKEYPVIVFFVTMAACTTAEYIT